MVAALLLLLLASLALADTPDCALSDPAKAAEGDAFSKLGSRKYLELGNPSDVTKEGDPPILSWRSPSCPPFFEAGSGPGYLSEENRRMWRAGNIYDACFWRARLLNWAYPVLNWRVGS